MGGRNLNPEHFIYYALSLRAELSSRELSFKIQIKTKK